METTELHESVLRAIMTNSNSLWRYRAQLEQECKAAYNVLHCLEDLVSTKERGLYGTGREVSMIVSLTER